MEFQNNNIGNVALSATPKKMGNLITNEVKQIAKEKAFSMPMGTYSRLKVNNEISDIVINPTSSGVWFHHEPNTIGKDISSKIVCFIAYKDLN